METQLGKRRMPTLTWGILFYVATHAACGEPRAHTPELRDISGVARSGDTLLLVDDEEPAVYFRFPIAQSPGPLILLDRSRLEAVPLVAANLAVDLESIDVLADGRVVVLSERLRALLDSQGVVVEYDPLLAEVGRRGLEGLAVQHLPGGSSRIAVLWEGGYPEYGDLHPQLRNSAGHSALRPLVLVHDLKKDQRLRGLRLTDAANVVELHVPLPAGQEPEAQRFRAPDLVWASWMGRRGQEIGFIVLISSLNSSGLREYRYHWLLRFTLAGEPVGEPLDLDRLAPELKGVNWEGLAWFEESRTLVAVCETSKTGRPVALLIPVPAAWR